MNDEGAHLPDLECGSWFVLALRCLTCPQIFPTFASEMQVYTGCNA